MIITILLLLLYLVLFGQCGWPAAKRTPPALDKFFAELFGSLGLVQSGQGSVISFCRHGKKKKILEIGTGDRWMDGWMDSLQE